MKALDLEFQPKGRAADGVRLALLALALAGLAQVVLDYRGLRLREGDTVQTLHQAQRQQNSVRDGAAAAVPPKAEDVQAANAIIGALNVPWGQLLESLEARAGNDIALLAIEPDVKKKTVRITGEARNLAALPDYVDVLAEQKLLQDVVLIEHQVQAQDPQRPVHFVIQASWRSRQEAVVSHVR